MKRVKNFFLKSGLLMMAMGMTFTSCNDEDALRLEVDKNLLSTGIVSDVEGGFFDIPIKSNGEWTASLPDDCEWAGLLGAKGNGDNIITLSIDDNYVGAGRSTVVTINNGEVTYNVAVTQETGNENAEFVNIAASKGLGYGYDPKNYKIKQSAVLNVKAMNQLAEEDDIEYGTLFESDRLSVLEVTDVNIDSLETKKDSLHVALSMSISYGTFKFGLSGGYHSSEERNTTMRQYRSAAHYPTLEARMGYADALSFYADYLAEQSEDPRAAQTEKDYRKSLLSNSFAKKMTALSAACDDNGVDSTKANKLAKEILNTYGPTVIVSSTLGGSFALEYYADSIYTHEEMGMDSAKVSAKISTGLFSLDAEVSAEYQKDMTEILQHSICSCVLKGGNSKDQAAIYEHFKAKEYGLLNEAVRDWISNMETSDDKKTNTAELISVDVVPIWIFAEGTAQDILKAYVMSVYKDVEEMEELAKYN